MGSRYPHKERSGLGNAVRVARAADPVLYEEKGIYYQLQGSGSGNEKGKMILQIMTQKLHTFHGTVHDVSSTYKGRYNYCCLCLAVCMFLGACL